MILCLAFLGKADRAVAQTLTLDTAAFVSGTYGPGSDIAVLFRAAGCFSQTNTFRLVLSDASGQFSSTSPVIGTLANSYYATFLNGILPTNLPAGQGYRLQLQSTQPAFLINTPAFDVSANVGGVLKAAATVAQPLRVLKTNEAYGFCTSPTLLQQLPLTDASSAGAGITGRLKDDYSGIVASTYQYNAGATQSVNLDRSYYTYLVKAERNGLVSTRAYSLINSRNRIILGVDGEQAGCLPQELEFQVGINPQSGGILENYPGTEYLVDWGDNTSTTYRYCDLVAGNGMIRHNYLSTSCNKPGVTYNITITVQQPWSASVGCDRPQVTTRAKISKKPNAYFQLPDTGCQGKAILIRNISDPGQQVFGQTCVSRADFFWYVNGVLVQSFYDKAPAQANLTYTFSQPGKNLVRLVVDNHNCELNDSTDTICIEPKPIAQLRANGGQRRISGCAPFDVVTVNGTNVWYCLPTQFNMQVQDAASHAVVSSQAGVYAKDSASHYRFLQPGRYLLILTATNFCNSSRDTVWVNVGTAPTLQWKSGLGRCDTGLVNFADTGLAPKYGDSSVQANIQWQVSGGTFATLPGKGLTTAFPQIRFLQAGTYQLQVQLNNGCGVVSGTESFVVQPRPQLSIGSAQTTLCFTDSFPVLTAQTNQPAFDSLVWISQGTGQLTGNGLQASYSGSGADRTAGSVQFLSTLYPTEKFCAPVAAQHTIYIRPNPGRADTTQLLCSGLPLTARFSSNGQLSHAFTAQTVAGQVSGMSSNGTGYPQDILVNQSNTQAASVVYRFISTESGCQSAPFFDTILVQPTPQLQALAQADTICNGTLCNLGLSSSIPCVYQWTSQSMPAGIITGHSQQGTGVQITQLADLLQTNQPGIYAAAVYTIRAVSAEGCISQPVTTQVTVKAGNSAALGGPDQLLCNQSTTQLQAQAPAFGQGQWQLLSGAGTLSSTTASGTTLSGLNNGDTARLVWQVSGHNGCTTNTDTVMVMSRPLVTSSDAGANQVFCLFTPNSIDSVLLNSQPAVHNYEIGRWQMIAQPSGAQAGVSNTYANNTPFLFNQPGSYRMAWLVGNDAGCPEAIDSVEIQVFTRPQAGRLISPSLSCSIDTVSLQSAGAVGQLHSWQQATDGISFTNFIPFNQHYLLPGTDSQWLRLIVRSEGWNAGCQLADTTATILIARVAETQPGFLLGADTLCNGSNNGQLQLQQALGTVNAWQMSVNGGQSWQSLAGGSNALPYFNLAQTTLYRAEVQNGICPARTTAPVQMTVHGGVTGVQASGQQQLCLGAQAQALQAQVNAGGFTGLQYYWEMSTDSIHYQPVGGATQPGYQPGLVGQTTWYRLQANAAVCGGQGYVASNTVRVDVMPVANAGFALNPGGCAPFNLQPNPAAAAHSSLQQQWFINQQPAGNGSFPGHIITQPGDSVRLLYKVSSNAGCGSDSMALWVKTLPKAQPTFVIPSFAPCGPVTLTPQNQTAQLTAFDYHWDFGNGSFSGMTLAGAQTFDPHPLGIDTTYYIKLKAMNACDTAMTQLPVLVKSRPKATFSPDKTSGCSPLSITFSNTTLGQNSYQWQFGDGSPVSSSNAGQLSHTYTTGRNDTVYAQLHASNSCGADSLRYTLVIHPSDLRIDLAINGNQAAGCAPYNVQLVNNSQRGNQFTWDFGDGQTLSTSRNLDTVAHVFTQPGQYTVKLRGINACSDTSTTENIFIGRRPQATIDAHTASLCIGDSLRLQGRSDSVQGYQWLMTGNSINGSSAHTAFTQAGHQSIALIALRSYANGLVCTDTARTSVLVNSTAPGKLLASDTSSLCGPLTVKLSHQHQAVQQTLWQLSDGSQRQGDTASFRISQNGRYLVKMFATTTAGCKMTDSAWVNLQSPQGNVQYSAALNCGDKPVQFNAQFSGADSIRWNFGDGNTATTTSGQVSHTYASQGRYLPTATLIGNNGTCRLPMLTTDTIGVEKVYVQLSFQSQQDCGQTIVRFNENDTRQNTQFQYLWRLGNGQTSTQPNARAVYTVSNQYPVFFRMQTANGCADSVQQLIDVVVKAKPEAAIGGDTSGCTSQSVRLKAVVNSADPITSYQWTGPNGFASAIAQPQFNAIAPGSYLIRLVVASSTLCYDTATYLLPVKASPQVRTTSEVLLCRGQQTPLQASGATSYSWSPASFLSCTGCPNPIANPIQTQRYVVTGTQPGNACAGTDTVWVKVAQPIRTTVSAGDSICAGEIKTLQAAGATTYQWFPQTGLSSATVASPLASPVQTTQYRVVGRDSAGCFSDTAYVLIGVGKPIQVSLGPDRTAATGDKIKLQPTVSGGTISQYAWKGGAFDCSNCPTPTLTVQGTTQVVLNAVSAYGCQASDTLNIKGFCESTQVFVANAFTPDNDGRNDYLYVQGKGIAMVKSLRVYNRWGQVVFEKVNMAPNDARSGWDGNIKGQPATTDVYVYTAEVVCDNNIPYTYKGNVTLIR